MGVHEFESSLLVKKICRMNGEVLWYLYVPDQMKYAKLQQLFWGD